MIAGEDEAVLLCGSAEAAALAERFGVEAVVKLGARGAVGWRNGEWADDAGIAVAPVDVVGAGDAFTAGYLDALLDGAGLARIAAPRERLRRDRRRGRRRCDRPAHPQRAGAGAGGRRRRRPLDG